MSYVDEVLAYVANGDTTWQQVVDHYGDPGVIDLLENLGQIETKGNRLEVTNAGWDRLNAVSR